MSEVSTSALTEKRTPDSRETAVIIGAGPAGLAAACALATRGISTRLFEKANIVGGKVQSYRDGGLSIEHGVHGWWVNYLNFDWLLEQVGVNLEFALKLSGASNLVRKDGAVYRLDKIANVPSPLHMLLECARAPFLTLADLVRFIPFAVHLLAFQHETDYARYDNISFQALMDSLHVSKRMQQLILTPFILSFDFAVPERVSAACGLSGCQFYILHDRRSIFTRWSRGLPEDTVFGKLSDFFQRLGGELLLGSPVDSIIIEDGRVCGVTSRSGSISPSGSPTVVGTIEASQIPSGDYVSLNTSMGPAWITSDGGAFLALNARCTHQGCSVAWNRTAHEFQCPCHGGRYDNHGHVLNGPPTQPLAAIATQLQGGTVQLLGQSQVAKFACEDVIVATDTRAAQELLDASPGVGEKLKSDVGKLDTTPVIVVRLWFDAGTEFPPGFESAITPEAEFIDNFFHLNEFSPTYDREGTIIEVQSYRVDGWLDRPDPEVLDIVFCDLSEFLPTLGRNKLKSWHIQRHRALFTRYAPGKVALRPGAESGVSGLYLAGDWTQADWSVWMMERAVVSGLRAASAVLVRRGLPPIDIRQMPAEGLLLRWSRRLARLLRSLFWSEYPKKR